MRNLKKLYRVTQILIFLSFFLIISGPLSYSTAEELPAAASLIIKTASGLTSEQQAVVIDACGGVETSTIPALRIHVVEIQTTDLAAAIENCRNVQGVVSVGENMTRKAEAIPFDRYYTTEQWALAKIGWESVFGSVTPTGTAKVAVLDTGVDASHPDLAGRVVSGRSVMDGSLGLTDPHGHGTWLAGIVAANTDNSEGIAGVGFTGVNIMPVTVLNEQGLGQDSDIIQGIIWAADNGADVILMGFSNPGFSGHLQEAIDYAWQKGAVLVASTGNEGQNAATFPAGHRGVIGVSATDADDNLAGYSNYGEAVFLAAPGTEIAATDLNNDYVVISGTSASSAIVAGVAAFMKAVEPELTNGVIVGRLARTADLAGTIEETGNGRVNMARALADTGTEEIQPAGAPGGGPYVRPYVVAAEGITATWTLSTTTISVTATGLNTNKKYQISYEPPSGAKTFHACFTGVDNSTDSLTLSGSYATGTWTVRLDAYNNNNIACTDSGLGQASRNGTTTGTVNVTAKANQTITVTTPAPATAVYNSSFSVAATASSGLSVAITAAGVCSGSGSGSATITMTSGTGTCTVNYNQAGNDSYNPAPQVSSSTTAQKANQATLTLNAGSPLTYNTSETLTTSGGSGTGLVTYSVTSGSCSVLGDQLTANSGTGSCEVSATKAADDNYNEATASATVTLQKANQATLTLNAGSPLTYNTSETLSTTGGSGTGAVTYSVTSGSCSVLGDQLTANSGTGSCEVSATKAADDNYNEATASATVTLQKANQATLTLNAGSPLTYNTSETLSTTGGSGTGAVTYSVTSGSCSVLGDQLTANSGTGSCEVSATKAADDNYNEATASATVTLQKALATVTLGNMTKTYAGSPLSPTATTSPPGLAIDWTGAPQTNAGSYSVTATVNDLNYYGSASGTFTINPRSITVTAEDKTKTFGDSDPELTFTVGGSGLASGDTIATVFSGDLTRDPGENVGTYAITQGSLTTANSNYTITTFTPGMLTITPYNITDSKVTVSPNPQQYSDKVTFEATLSPASINGQAPATSVTFYVGTQNMGSCTFNGSLSCKVENVPLLEPVPFGTSPTGQMAPGANKTVTAKFGGVNPNFFVSDATTSLTITREDARAYYTGDTFVSTGSSTSSTATVVLSATIKDITAVDLSSDPDAGDIRNAKVTFVFRNGSDTPITGCTDLPVGLISSSDTKVGTATCNWTANIGTADSQTYIIGIIVNNYYTRNDAEDNTTITVSKSMNNFITGGGYLANQNSAGICSGEAGRKTNFGFNVKYNKSLTNLQGNMNIIVRSAESCTPGYTGPRVYQIKTNAMQNLTVKLSTGAATFTSKANIQDVTDPANPIPLDGNGTLRVTMDDNGEPGRNDTIGITFWNGAGGLWFSSSWNGTTTVEQLLGGGNLQVR